MLNNKKSFIQFYKEFKESRISDTEAFRGLLNKLELETQEDGEYESFPVNIKAGKLPIVFNENIYVKVVTLEQGEDKLALIVPEGIALAYKGIVEDPESIKKYNTNFTLLVDTFGFDQNSAEFKTLIKYSYLSSLNYDAAYEDLRVEKVEPKEDEPSTFDRERPMFNNRPVSDTGEEIVKDVEDFATNESALTKFKKQTTKLESLLKHIESNFPRVLLENINVSFYNNTLLVISVDNKTLVESLDAVPNYSKGLLSMLGESIKAFDSVQLVDTAPYKNGRVFLVAESVGNNFWLTESDDIRYTTNLKNLVKPNDDDIIILKKSSVRLDERAYKPLLSGKDLLFKRR